MFKDNGKLTDGNLWITLPLLLLLLAGLLIWFVHIPIGSQAISQGKHITQNFRIKKDASHFPARLKKINKELAVLDSVLGEVEGKKDATDQRIPDQLYVWADSAGFTAETVEAGMPQLVADHKETAVSITGKGSYASIGKFIASIESCSQSTRIRQLQIKRGEERHLEVFIDFVVREENRKTL